MSKNKDLLEVDGEITEVLPNQMYRVQIENGPLIIAYTGGRLRQNKIRIIAGDHVKLEMTPYDLTKGRIVYRY